MNEKVWRLIVVGLLLAFTLGACGTALPAANRVGAKLTNRDAQLPQMTAARLANGEKLRVVATTGIVGDVVANVAGDLVDLTTLMAPGQDPHTYQPIPRDIAAIERAHVVFINGLGLEEGLESTIDAAAGKDKPVVSVSAGIQSRQPAAGGQEAMPATSGEAQQHATGDPHVWFDPANVKIWVRNIERSLSALDPENAAAYGANAAVYTKRLDELDAYIQTQVAKIPPQRRKLVTDHEAFGYFADRYGFEITGAVIASISTTAEPSARDLAALTEKIRAQAVPAVFVGMTTNPQLSELVAREAGVQVLRLYSGEMGAPGTGAETYIGMMRTDMDTILKGLGQ